MNGSYEGDDPIGHLMSDFRNKGTEGFYNKELEKAVRHFKKTEGETDMCEAVEEYGRKQKAEGIAEGRAEGRAEGSKEALLVAIRNIMNNLGIDSMQAMKNMGIPESDYPIYLSKL